MTFSHRPLICWRKNGNSCCENTRPPFDRCWAERNRRAQNRPCSLLLQEWRIVLSLFSLFIFAVVVGTGCTSPIQKIRTTDEVSKLQSHLKHEKSWKREEAALRLGELQAAKATPTLVELLNDPAPWVREAAARALRKIDDPRSVKPLIKRLKDETNVDVQCAIIMTLGALDEYKAIPVLREKRKSANILVKGCAKFAEKKIRQ